jgi:hypothetical protein
MRRLTSLLLTLAPLTSAVAQGLSPDLLADWERNRTAVLSYIDAMPDSATGYRPTGVRTLAEQFDHIVTTGPELVRAAGKQAYIVYPNGIGRSRLPTVLIEKKLGTKGTGRNWNTVLKLEAAGTKTPTPQPGSSRPET